MPPPEEVRSKIQKDVHVYFLIYTFIFLVIQVRIARPTYHFLFIHLSCWLSRSGLPGLLSKLANLCLNNMQPSQNAIIHYRKMYSRKHAKFGETARIQYGCNALWVVCWARVRKVSYWNAIDLDYDLGDNLLKYLGFNRFLDASDPRNHSVLDGFNCSITKFHIHDGEAIIGNRRFFPKSISK